ncbi:MAG: flavodoxin [Bacteroides sp.]|nr:flavodoxin [Bacteroides sp.]MCM1413121.1 flavodoxin [Bacteroides sp.]MCM1472137.1 flavodoxin [Bacteroides sp.]
MKRTGIFYASVTGATALVADKIASRLNVESKDIHNVVGSSPSQVDDYDLILLGCSTWGNGDLPGDMHDFLNGVEALSLKGKEVALFGCGDEEMSTTFCDAVGEMYDMVQSTCATVIGAFNVDDYHFEQSKAVKDGEALGLLIDDTNHPELTDARIDAWCEKLTAD